MGQNAEHQPATKRDGRIAALQNGLAVLDMFSSERQTLTVAEIARRLEIHKSTASRIASTLVSSGFLRAAHVGTGFQLTGKLTRLGNLAASDTALSTAAMPYLRELVDALGETCHLGVLEGGEAVTAALVDGVHAVRLHSYVGKRSPAHCTALGKVLLADMPPAQLLELYPDEVLIGQTEQSVTSRAVLLAQLESIRLRGYAVDDEELEPGLRCVAAPVRGPDGAVVASLTVSGASARMTRGGLDAAAGRIQDAAERLSASLGAPVSEAAR
jgi:DNA-binding IclR family transcriptional regulator